MIFMNNAEMEQQHAKQYFSFLEGRGVQITASYPAGKVGTTVENLLASIEGEREEHEELYPHFGDIAEKEGFPKIAMKFRQIAKIEGQHAQRFRECLQYLKNEQNKNLPQDTVWICMRCGHKIIGPEPPAGRCRNSAKNSKNKQTNNTLYLSNSYYQLVQTSFPTIFSFPFFSYFASQYFFK